METTNKKLLIGGQALRAHGSTRHTADFDFLVFDESQPIFFFTEDADYVNAAANKFFAEVWAMENENTGEVASLDAIAELKAFSYVQDCQNRQWAKADCAEFDLTFCARNGAKLPTIVKKYIPEGIYTNEIKKIWDKVASQK
jgi:hypothetical protein